MKAIFITPEDVKRYSVMNGNVDVDKFLPFCEVAQDIYIQEYLGSALYEKLQALIIADEVDLVGNAAYKTLLETYVKPVHIHWAISEFLPYISYTISNSGMKKHGSETSETVSKTEIDYLSEKSKSTAQFYTKRLIDFICDNQTDYPEYYSNTGDQMPPNHNAYFTGWVL